MSFKNQNRIQKPLKFMEIRSCMTSDQIAPHSVQLPLCIAQILSQVLILCGGGGYIFVVFGGGGGEFVY